MKHKGSDSETLCERDEFILETFLKLKRSCEYETMYRICEVIAQVSVGRHYISEAMAAIIWAKWKRLRCLPKNTNHYKRMVYESFIRECEKLREQGTSNRTTIRTALEQPAPCLGISPHRVFVILKKRGQK